MIKRPAKRQDGGHIHNLDKEMVNEDILRAALRVDPTAVERREQEAKQGCKKKKGRTQEGSAFSLTIR